MLRQDDRTLRLVRRAKQGDERAFDTICKAMEEDLRRLAKRLFINGADSEDVIQEGRIGIWNAVRSYKEGAGSSFNSFALMCSKRNIMTHMTTANRQKSMPLTKAISLDTPIATGEEEGEQSIMDFMSDENTNVAREVEFRAQFEDFEQRLLQPRRLTPMERACYLHFRNGDTYKEIAEHLTEVFVGIDVKAVDNALTRVRKKIAEVRGEMEAVNEAEYRRLLHGFEDAGIPDSEEELDALIAEGEQANEPAQLADIAHIRRKM